jgi:lysophospholipase L1-like esterase
MRKLLLVLLGLGFALTAQAQEGHWVATWGTAPLLQVETLPPWVEPPPADTLPADPPPSPIPPVPSELRDQTLRMIVRTSLGGAQLRLQFANAQGVPPVTLGKVHVAVSTTDSMIDPATDHAVTFGGQESVTLRPGALVVSDPVPLRVDALAELAVSVYVADTADTRARHELGLNTTFVAAGNVVAAATLVATETNRSYFWLSGIDVLAPADSAAIVAFGDSITDGFATTADAHQAWPSLLAARLQQDARTAHLGVVNAGISGNRVLRNNVGASALTRFDRDVLARGGVEWMILLEGINDVTWSALPRIPAAEQASAADIIEGLAQLVARAHAHGIKVMGATLTPMEGLWLYNPETEALRQEVNAWIRGTDVFDAVVDFDAITRDSAAPQRLRPDHDSGDHIHPNDAGNAAMAEAIDLGSFIR